MIKPITRQTARFAFVLALILVSNVACGDAVVVTKAMSAGTIAEVFVETDKIRIELEIGPEDIHVFRDILPDQVCQKLNFVCDLPFRQRQEKFFDDGMVVKADGKKLNGTVAGLDARQRIARDEITGNPLDIQPKDGPIVIYAQLEYPFVSQPKQVSLRPPLKDDRVTANIGFITYHRELPVMDFRYLSKEETLELDWVDPWYSKFKNRNLKRQFDAPLSVFLYVEPFEVRVEAVTRPIDVGRWTDLNIDADGVIPISDQARLKKQVADFLQDRIELKIDGQRVTATLDRIHFLNRTLRKTGVVYPDQELKSTSATLGVIYVCPIEELPQQVELDWKIFDERIKEVPSVATDEAGGLPWTLTADEPTLTWKNYLTQPTIPAMLSIPPPPQRPHFKVPLITFSLIVTALFLLAIAWSIGKQLPVMKTIGAIVAVILGAASLWYLPNKVSINQPFAAERTVSKDDALEVSKSLLHNVYRSFDRRDESIVYDQLATAVSGDLLREMYFQIMQGIRLEDQGGARITVNEVDVLDSTVDLQPDTPGFETSMRWNIIGTVGHWGHLHQRANQYDADFKIQPIDGSWKIVSMRIKDVVGLGAEPVN